MSGGLELRGVECRRGLRSLFRGLSADVAAGRLLRVQGANGAGKTSLLRIICGLLAPAQGQVFWRGQHIATLREEFGRDLLYLGHAAALKDDLSPLENLLAAAALGGAPTGDAEAIAALGQAGLRGRERVPTRILSQGQRRRVALARLVLGRAAGLWVLDEPFNALDATAVSWLSALVTDQVGHGGIVVLTSHQSVHFNETVQQMTISL